MRLQVNDIKYHAYSRSHGASQPVSATTEIPHALRRLVGAGTLLGEDEIVHRQR